mmetsp:Transcript_30056/g.81474  ORF Transcript_30056/g.81474 Transcript_30056/m.81474 type:complete len:308 (+) Transcript_30056:240-1163(+)
MLARAMTCSIATLGLQRCAAIIMAWQSRIRFFANFCKSLQSAVMTSKSMLSFLSSAIRFLVCIQRTKPAMQLSITGWPVMKKTPAPTAGEASSFIWAEFSSSELSLCRLLSIWKMLSLNSATCWFSSGNLNDLSLFSKFRRNSSMTLEPSSSMASGSRGLDSGAICFNLDLNCSRSKSRVLKTSTFTKASRSCTAALPVPRNASTKFFKTFSNVEGVTSAPRGDEGFGKLFGSKKDLVNSSNNWKKSLPISENSPWKLGSRTPSPGCGRPKQETVRKTSLSRSAVSFRPATPEFSIFWRCCVLCSLH